MNAVSITPSPLTVEEKTKTLPLTEDEKNILKSLYFLDTKIELIIDRINGNVKLILSIREIIQTFGPTGTILQRTSLRFIITTSLNRSGIR